MVILFSLIQTFCDVTNIVQSYFSKWFTSGSEAVGVKLFVVLLNKLLPSQFVNTIALVFKIALSRDIGSLKTAMLDGTSNAFRNRVSLFDSVR